MSALPHKFSSFSRTKTLVSLAGVSSIIPRQSAQDVILEEDAAYDDNSVANEPRHGGCCCCCCWCRSRNVTAHCPVAELVILSISLTTLLVQKNFNPDNTQHAYTVHLCIILYGLTFTILLFFLLLRLVVKYTALRCFPENRFVAAANVTMDPHVVYLLWAITALLFWHRALIPVDTNNVRELMFASPVEWRRDMSKGTPSEGGGELLLPFFLSNVNLWGSFTTSEKYKIFLTKAPDDA